MPTHPPRQTDWELGGRETRKVGIQGDWKIVESPLELGSKIYRESRSGSPGMKLAAVGMESLYSSLSWTVLQFMHCHCLFSFCSSLILGKVCLLQANVSLSTMLRRTRTKELCSLWGKREPFWAAPLANVFCRKIIFPYPPSLFPSLLLPFPSLSHHTTTFLHPSVVEWTHQLGLWSQGDLHSNQLECAMDKS